jgi:ABC-type lipoprotein export system ATPase subunit
MRYHRQAYDVVSRLSFAIPAGQICALVGPSGCGKSTILYALGGLLRPRSGQLLVNEVDLWSLNDSARSLYRSTEIGFLYQDLALDYGRSIKDNVVEPLVYSGRKNKLADGRARELLRAAGVSLPVDRRPYQVSGGQGQRIALARALIADPAVLLADEPTSSLDDHSACAVLDLIEKHLDSPSSRLNIALIATHDPRVLERAKLVIGINAGDDEAAY